MTDTRQLSDILKEWYRWDVRTQKINYISDENPKVDTNPEKINAVWYNRTTGEIFICKDNNPDKNVWIGTNGTIIAPSTLSKFDIFEDGSAIALWNFDGNLNDVGGLYNGVVNGTEPSTGIYTLGRYGKCLRSYYNYFNIKFHIPELNDLDVVTVSAWVKWSGWSCCVMPFGFNRYDIYTCCYDFGFNTGCGDIYGFGDAYSKLFGTWFHIVAEFHKGDVLSNKLWINGEQIELEQRRGSPCLNNAVFGEYFYIFGWGANASYRHFGLVDQVRLFNRPLTDLEVQILYNER